MATPPLRGSVGATVAAVVALVVVLLAGAYLILSLGPAGTVLGIDWVVIITVGWFFLVSAAIARVTARRPELATPLRAAFLTIAVAGSAFFVWDTWLRAKTETNEQIVQVPATDAAAEDDPAEAAAEDDPAEAPARDRALGRGSFVGVDGHDAEGTTALIELADGGHVLTFDDLEVDKAPDLRVYLVKGDSVGDGNYVDLGALKAEKGRFQYKLDDDVDVDRYDHVFVWCRAFSVGIGRAELGSG